MSCTETSPLIVALEGPSLAGKSTTIEAIRDGRRTFSVEIVPEFSDFVGSGALLPPLIPMSAGDRLDAVSVLAAIDERRCAAALKSSADVVILDRSLHSIIAISYALEGTMGLPVFEATKTRLRQAPTLWPDLIFFLISPSELRVARSCDRADDNPHVSGPIQTLVRQYFEIISSDLPVRFLRSDVALEGVAAEASRTIERHLRSRERARRRPADSYDGLSAEMRR